MISLRWYVRRWSGTLGWQGVVGLGLIAVAVALYVGGIAPSKAQIRELQQEAVSIRAFSQRHADAANAKAPTQEAWVEQFYRLLPDKGSAPDWLRLIFSAARTHSLGLQQGDYKVTVDKNGRLVAYEIALPVRGTYVQIRKFIAEVLEQVPAIALDEVTMKRESISDSRVEAAIRFTLYLNAA